MTIFARIQSSPGVGGVEGEKWTFLIRAGSALLASVFQFSSKNGRTKISSVLERFGWAGSEYSWCEANLRGWEYICVYIYIEREHTREFCRASGLWGAPAGREVVGTTIALVPGCQAARPCWKGLLALSASLCPYSLSGWEAGLMSLVNVWATLGLCSAVRSLPTFPCWHRNFLTPGPGLFLLDSYSSVLEAAVLTLDCATEFPAGLVKTQIAGHHTEFLIGWDTSSKFPDTADAAGPGTKLWKPLF